MRILLAIALIAVLLSLGYLNQARGPSLDRLADRVERLVVIPDETRDELNRLVGRVKRNGPGDRNATAAARIERALEFKPAQRAQVR